MSEFYSSELDYLKGKVTRVVLSQPLYLIGENERFQLSEISSLKRPPTLKDVTGYLTRYALINQPSERGHLVINPFGINNLTLDGEGSRKGDVIINLVHIKRLEEVVLR